jgi:hypothetical protein
LFKTIQKQPELEDLRPAEPEIERIEEIDLSARIYPINEYVDDSGRVIVPLRGEYECGNNDNESGISASEFEGYRNFKERTRWASLTELLEERELRDLNRREMPIAREKGGHTTIYGEFVPHTQINDLLTQNPECGGFVDDGCGENEDKLHSPKCHPISFSPAHGYWDEMQYCLMRSAQTKFCDKIDHGIIELIQHRTIKETALMYLTWHRIRRRLLTRRNRVPPGFSAEVAKVWKSPRFIEW